MKPLGGVIVAVAIAAVSILVSFRSVYEPDLGWHLAQGRENFYGRLIRSNVFSYTYPDYRQRYTSWLTETSAYAAWQAGGDAAIQTLEALTVAAALALVYLACRVQGAALPSAAILILGLFVLEPRVIPRPHLVSFAGIAACSWLIERAIDNAQCATVVVGSPARRALEQPSRRMRHGRAVDRDLRDRGTGAALGAHANAGDSRSADRGVLRCGVDAQSLRLGTSPVSLREPVGAAGAQASRSSSPRTCQPIEPSLCISPSRPSFSRPCLAASRSLRP